MTAGAFLLIGLAVLAAVLLMGIGLVAFSRLSGSAKSFPCAYRVDADQAWRRGLLHYDTDRLDHFGPGGPFRDAQHHWHRSTLVFGFARSQDEAETPWLTSPVIAVPCQYADEHFELALGQGHYTALRSWLESVPPGWNANVA